MNLTSIQLDQSILIAITFVLPSLDLPCFQIHGQNSMQKWIHWKTTNCLAATYFNSLWMFQCMTNFFFNMLQFTCQKFQLHNLYSTADKISFSTTHSLTLKNDFFLKNSQGFLSLYYKEFQHFKILHILSSWLISNPWVLCWRIWLFGAS